jgi:hypothetical protein
MVCDEQYYFPSEEDLRSGVNEQVLMEKAALFLVSLSIFLSLSFL